MCTRFRSARSPVAYSQSHSPMAHAPTPKISPPSAPKQSLVAALSKAWSAPVVAQAPAKLRRQPMSLTREQIIVGSATASNSKITDTPALRLVGIVA